MHYSISLYSKHLLIVWKAEYTRFLMTENKGFNKKDYACVDKDAEPIDNGTSNKNGALFYAVRTTFGS